MKKAFTLIEMLIVIIIIGILMSALLPKLSEAQNKSIDIGNIGKISKIKTALIMYEGDNFTFPSSINKCTDGLSEALYPFKGNKIIDSPDLLKSIGKGGIKKANYGTKEEGCINSFGYKSLYKFNKENSGFVITYNPLTINKSNFIIPNKEFFRKKTSGEEMQMFGILNPTKDTLNNSPFIYKNTDFISDITNIGFFICQKVELGASNKGCFSGKSEKGTAINNDNFLYVTY